MEHSPGLTPLSATRWALVKFKKIKIHIKHLFWSQHHEIRNNSKTHKHVMAKQYASQQPWNHWRNQRGNKRIPRNKQKRKHNGPQILGCSKPHRFPVFDVGIVIPPPQRLTQVQWEHRWNSPCLPATEPARSCGTREGGRVGTPTQPQVAIFSSLERKPLTTEPQQDRI